MSNAEIIITALGVLSPIVSVVVAIIVARRNKDKDTKNAGQKEGVMQSDIGYIKSSTDRIEKRFDKFEEKQDQMMERLVKVEQGLSDHIKDKNAHNYKISKGGK